LIAATKTRYGIDPTVVPGLGSIANFDKDQGNYQTSGDGLGTLPEGTPDAFPDGYDVPTLSAESGITWTAPDYSREMKDRRTTGAHERGGSSSSGGSSGGGDSF